MVEQATFRAPFVTPSSFYGGKQSGLKEGCLVLLLQFKKGDHRS